MHVLPGMQGNNIWLVRQLARLRSLQGRAVEAEHLTAEANAMAAETIRTMYGTSADGTRGWWNVIWADGPNGTKPLRAHEMRHVNTARQLPLCQMQYRVWIMGLVLGNHTHGISSGVAFRLWTSSAWPSGYAV